jgi:hypothetical protein
VDGRSVSLISSDVPPPGLSPEDLQDAYGLRDAAKGPGQRVFVIGVPSPSLAADLAAYREQFALPACTIANGCLDLLDSQGVRVAAIPADGPPDGQDRTTVATELISAVCPNCDIAVLGVTTARQLTAATNTVEALGGRFVTFTESVRPTISSKIKQLDFPLYDRIVYSASSGNDGWLNGRLLWPQSAPGVLNVGSTILEGNQLAWREKASPYSGSGCISSEPKPTWQNTVPVSACSGRATSDISATSTRMAVYAAGAWSTYYAGGVSQAIIAGVAALQRPPAEDESPPAYVSTNATGSTVEDITDGASNNNGDTSCPTALCTPGPGWDGPTGPGVLKGPGALKPPTGQAKTVQSGQIIYISQDPTNKYHGLPRCLGVAPQDTPTAYLAGVPVDIGPCGDPTRLQNWKIQAERARRNGLSYAPLQLVYRLRLDIPHVDELPCLTFVDPFRPVGVSGCQPADVGPTLQSYQLFGSGEGRSLGQPAWNSGAYPWSMATALGDTSDYQQVKQRQLTRMVKWQLSERPLFGWFLPGS